MIVIRSLEQIRKSQLSEIGPGYTSTQVYRVRKTESDHETVLSLTLETLETRYHKTFPHENGLLSYYRSVVRRGLSLGAYEDEQLIGLAIADAQDWNRTLLLWEFHVAPSHQGRGIGRDLMNALVEKAQAAGMRAISVETSNTNVPAIRFYRRMGFTLDSIDLSFYSNEDLEKGEIAVFMKRKL